MQETSPAKKRKMNDDQPVISHNDDVPRLDTLPLELLHQIVVQLVVKDFFCITLASSGLYWALKDFKGTDIRTASDLGIPVRTRAQIIAEFESHCTSPNKLGKLTCSVCCQSAGVGLSGFSDEHFKQSLATRKCVDCLLDAKQTHGIFTFGQTIKLYSCHICHEMQDVSNVATKEDLEKFYDSLWKPSAAANSVISKSIFGVPKQKLSECTLVCRQCIPSWPERKRAMLTAERVLLAVLDHTFGSNDRMRVMLGLTAARPQGLGYQGGRYPSNESTIADLAEKGRKSTWKKKCSQPHCHKSCTCCAATRQSKRDEMGPQTH